MFNSIIFEHEGVKITGTDLFGMIIGRHGAALADWALTYRTGYADCSITNLAEYRNGTLLYAEQYERWRRAFVAAAGATNPPRQRTVDAALQQLRAMTSRSKYAACYTGGVRAQFPKDVVQQAEADLATFVTTLPE